MAALDPGTIGDRVAPLGFELIENLSPEEQGELYFGSYPPGFRPAGFYHIARLRRA